MFSVTRLLNELPLYWGSRFYTNIVLFLNYNWDFIPLSYLTICNNDLGHWDFHV